MLYNTPWLGGKIIAQQTMGALSMARRSKYDQDYDLFNYAQDYQSSTIVYMATNAVNGKRYIGMTRQALSRRSGQHIAVALRGKDGSPAFHRAIRRHGADAFEFTTLGEFATYAEAAKEEVRLIAELKPEYNSGPGGESVPNIGFRPSSATIEKIRQSVKANPNRYWLGKKRPDIAERQRKKLTGRPDLMQHMLAKAHTPETRAKISVTMRSRPTPPKQLEAMAKRRKKIICDDGRVFIGSQAAADAMGVRQDYMLHVLRGRRHPTVGGLRFWYADEDDGQP